MTYPKPERGHGALYGTQLQPRTIAQLAYDAGWQDAEVLAVAVCVCLAESQGYDHAIHVNHNGSEDRGLWQLSSVHKNITDAIAYDPKRATAAAFNLYMARQSSFNDWRAYTDGVFLHDPYLGRACVGVANFLAERMLPLDVPDHPDGSPYKHRFSVPVANFQHRVADQLVHVERAGKKNALADRRGVAVELGLAKQAAKALLPE